MLIAGEGRIGPCLVHGVEGRECEGEGEVVGIEGVEGGGKDVCGEVREGVEHVDDEEGEGRSSLGLHPARHRHRHELGAQAPALPAPQPRLRSTRRWRWSGSRR